MGDGKKADEPLEMISLTQLMRMLDRDVSAREGGTDDIDDTQGSGPTPRVTRMPDGFEVLEQRVGRAVGHWVLQVRCGSGGVEHLPALRGAGADPGGRRLTAVPRAATGAT
jgi:hypothetical protein